MFEYIVGNVAEIREDTIVLENNGIGYKLLCPKSSMINLSRNDRNVKLFVYMSVKEDGITLFGFSTYDEIEMFKLLTTVSKVGPKTALSALSVLSVSKIVTAIKLGDVASLSETPGVGKKTAERIILELKDKVDAFGFNLTDIDDKGNLASGNDDLADIYGALTSLGYSEIEINKALSKIDLEGISIETAIREVIKNMR